MAAQETYPHAPIVEAVLDIRTRLSSGLSIETLKEIHDGEKDAYPITRQPFLVQFKFEKKDAETDPITDTSYASNGQMFVSKDGLQLFQARPDGFSHNRLKPYTNWISFRGEARRLWDKYRNIAKPEVVEMLGLNFINKITIPSGKEISEYLRAYVEVPKELPQTLEVHNFLIQMTDPESNAKIAISVSFGSADEENKVPVTLNIQSFAFINKPMNQINEDEIWGTFDTLRGLKNLAFESSITEKVKAEFR